ncbi:MAG: SRPBCC family protein [Chloroflexi bacterium]|nr:SRPBCC family protein [Chloroflexota bacterium]
MSSRSQQLLAAACASLGILRAMTVIHRASLIVEESVVVQADAAKVWRVVTELQGWPRWVPGCRKARAGKGTPWEQGFRFEFDARPWWPSSRVKATVTDVATRRGVVWDVRGGGVMAQQRVALAEDGTSTKVTLRTVAGGHAPGFSPFDLVAALRSKYQSDVERLREASQKFLAALKAEAEKAT